MIDIEILQEAFASFIASSAEYFDVYMNADIEDETCVEVKLVEWNGDGNGNELIVVHMQNGQKVEVTVTGVKDDE